MKKIIFGVIVALLASASMADVITVAANTNDQQWSGSSAANAAGANVSQATARTGSATVPSTYRYVIPFQLPVLPDGQSITDASLSAFLTGVYIGKGAEVYLDVFAGRTAATSVTAAADWGATNMVGDNIARIFKDAETVNTLKTVALNAAFFQNIYNTDPNAAGKYIFLTVAPEVTPATSSQYLEWATANNATVTNRPVLSLTTGGAVAPTAAFSASETTGAVPFQVTFSDLSTGSITNRYWDFGDGTTTNSLLTAVQHSYSATGTYTVTLTVSGPGGSDTSTQPNLITAELHLPEAIFNAAPVTGTVPLQVTFTDSSTGSITNRYWDFGDGSTANTMLTSFDHTYTTAGTYTVELVVSGPVGSSTNTQTGLITATLPVAPTASFTPGTTTGSRPLAVTFTDTSTGTITNRYWDFGDGATTNITLTAVQHTYSAIGTYTVVLTASGPAGSDTYTQAGLITVTNPPPVMWGGAGSDNYWNTVANWVGGAKPNFLATAGFSGDAGATPNPDLNGAAITGIGIDFQSAGWILSDTAGTGSLRIDGGLTLSSAGAGVNRFDVNINGSGTAPVLINIGAGNTLQISKGFAQSRYDFSSSAGTLVFDGSIIQGVTGSTTTNPGGMTLLVNTTGGGAYRYSNLESYGRFGGTGTVMGYQYGTSRFYAGAVLAPGGNGTFGAEIGTLFWTCNTNTQRHNIELESGSIFEVQIGAAPGSSDKLLYETYANGFINIKSGAVLNLLSDGAVQDGTYTIMENVSTDVRDIEGTFSTVNYNGTEASPANFTVNYLGDSISVTVAGMTGGGPVVPPPPPVVSLGPRGAGQDVIHWTTAQGSGYVYSVYYSTNLLNGFQSLETGLSDTVTSITNPITASPVFYKIEAQ